MAIYQDDENYEEVLNRLLQPGDILDADAMRKEEETRAQTELHLQQLLSASRPGYEFADDVASTPAAPAARTTPPASIARIPGPESGLDAPPPGPSTDERKAAAMRRVVDASNPEYDFWRTRGTLEDIRNIGQGLGNLGQAIGSLRPGGPSRPGAVDTSRANQAHARAFDALRQRQAQELQAAEQAYDRRIRERQVAAYETQAQGAAEVARQRAKWAQDPRNPQNQQRAASAELAGVRAQGLSIANSQARELDNADDPEATAFRNVLMRIPAEERQRIGIPMDEELAELDAQALSGYLSGYRQLLARQRRASGGGGGRRQVSDDVVDAVTHELVTYQGMGDDPAHTRRLVEMSMHPDPRISRTATAALNRAGAQGIRVGESASRQLDEYNELRSQARIASRSIERVKQALEGMSPEEIRSAMLRRPLPSGANPARYNNLLQAYENMSANIRHELFGSALTGGELESWKAMTGAEVLSDPNMLVNFVNMREEIAQQTEDHLQHRFPRAVAAESGQVYRTPTGEAPRARQQAPQQAAPAQTTARPAQGGAIQQLLDLARSRSQ